MNANRKFPGLLRKARLAVVAAVLAVAVIEGAMLAMDNKWPVRPVDFDVELVRGSRIFVPMGASPDWLETAPEKIGRDPADPIICHQRFRARKAPGVYRVIMLGGSSTRNLMPYLPSLAERLGKTGGPKYHSVEIINAGACGYGSERVARIAREAMDYQPDCMLLYAGHNEAAEIMQVGYKRTETPVRDMLRHSACYRRYADWKLEKEEARLARSKSLQAVPERDDVIRWIRTNPSVIIRGYESNVAAIAEMCRTQEVRLILATVAGNLAHPMLRFEEDGAKYAPVTDLINSGRYKEAAALGSRILAGIGYRWQVSAAENDVVRKVAAEHGIPLADVESAVIAAEPHHLPGEMLFRDHCHLNDLGNMVLIRTIEPFIAEAIRTR